MSDGVDICGGMSRSLSTLDALTKGHNNASGGESTFV